MRWSEEQDKFLMENYPSHGKRWCAVQLGRTVKGVMGRASRLGLRIDLQSEFMKQAQEKARQAAKKRVGNKYPERGRAISLAYKEGRVLRGWGPKPPPKKSWKPVPPPSPEVLAERRRQQGERIRALWARRPHPRGMSGKKHSSETCAKMSAIGRGRPAAEKAEIYAKQMATRIANKKPFRAPERVKTTWRAAWREIGGKRSFYRSMWEANYARYLEWLRAVGHIEDWAHEPCTFWFEGIKRGCVSYLPDFSVKRKSGLVEYHEVKGWMDDRSKTKIARMAKYHPEVTLVVIDAKAYQELKRRVAAMVPGWEKL